MAHSQGPNRGVPPRHVFSSDVRELHGDAVVAAVAVPAPRAQGGEARYRH